MSLELRKIGKTFAGGQLRILHELDLSVAAGEILAVVGESGSGKSTLLSLIAGFETPDEGEIRWDGKGTAQWNEDHWSDFRKQSLGFVFQSYHLIPYLTALENVALPLRLSSRQGEPDEWLRRLGLSERSAHLPAQLSGGERQRVAIGRALIHRPKLVLADEPTGSLDVKTGAQVLDLLFSVLREAKQTAILVTHSREVASRCNRVLELRQGRLWPA